jgi:putative flippase GtrA
MSRVLQLEAYRFLVVGLLNTAVGLSVIFAAMGLFGFNDIAANAVGYAVGLTVSFIGNRHWTFRDNGPKGATLARFLLSFAFAYVVNLIVVLFVRDGLHLNPYFAQLAGICVYTPLFFVISRSLVFTERTPPR